MNIIIRVDASLVMGSGHVMRCLTLAQQLRTLNHTCYFICREQSGNLADSIHQQGFDVILLPPINNKQLHDYAHCTTKPYAHSAWLGVSEQQDAKDCLDALALFQTNHLALTTIDWVIVDHYAIAAPWHQYIKQALVTARLMVIDDLADRPYDCEILLDQTLGREPHDYTTWVSKHCRLLLGTRYSLLRQEFREWRKHSLARRARLNHIDPSYLSQAENIAHSRDCDIISDNAETSIKILVNLGGVDQTNVTLQVLRALVALSAQINVTVVMGKTAPHIATIQAFAADAPYHCQVLVNVDNMAELMAAADIAIGASGSTSWERCCLGLPAIIIVLAENQRLLAEQLASYQAAIALFDSNQLAQQLPQALETLIKQLPVISQKAAQLVDGQGARRVANHINEYEWLTQAIIRFATHEDVHKIWQWRNDIAVRQWMFDQSMIELSSHQQWFERQLTNPQVFLLMFVLGDEPVGFINIRLNDDGVATWGFYLAPDYQQHKVPTDTAQAAHAIRPKGLGQLLAKLTLAFIFNQNPALRKVFAQVLDYNTRSQALHERIGFVQEGRLRAHCIIDSRSCDVLEFGLLADEFFY